MFGVPPPQKKKKKKKHFAIGYIHKDNLPLGNIPLQFVIQSRLQEGVILFSDDFLHFLKIKKKYAEFTKTILWL